MPKLLIISGPTATGKTDLAELVASKISSELVSADSRQIYKGMDIGTGKDHNLKTTIHLVDIVNPDQSFSAFDFATMANEKIQEIHNKKKLPIVVGGTGFYLHALLNPSSINSPNIQNHFLFSILNKFPVNILKNIYKIIAPLDFKSLNNSEQNNPHRLVKRILLKLVSQKVETGYIPSLQGTDILHIHLAAQNTYIHSKIDRRVDLRLEQGLLAEISNLLKTYTWGDPGLKTLAYQEFQAFFKKADTLQNCVQTWTTHEKQYVKRQKTYFQKYFPDTTTIDISKKSAKQTAINKITTWYNKA